MNLIWALRSFGGRWTPSQADWLNDLSSILPTSVPRPTLIAGPLGLAAAAAAGLSAGFGAGVAVGGAAGAQAESTSISTIKTVSGVGRWRDIAPPGGCLLVAKQDTRRGVGHPVRAPLCARSARMPRGTPVRPIVDAAGPGLLRDDGPASAGSRLPTTVRPEAASRTSAAISVLPRSPAR